MPLSLVPLPLIESPVTSGPGFAFTQQARQIWQAESSSLSYG
jgi:hypothetical protein